MEKYHILAIDDDAATLDLYTAALEDSDYTFDVAVNGGEGIRLARGHRPDLIFLDLMMPVINGIETLECLRDFLPDVPVYIVTAFDRSLGALISAEHAEALAFEVCCKPVSAAQLRQIADGNFLGMASSTTTPAVTLQPEQKLDLRLYITGQTVNSIRARKNIKTILQVWDGPHYLEIVDIIKYPHRATADGIVATPTLLKLQPSPSSSFIGHFSDHAELMLALGLNTAWAKLTSRVTVEQRNQ